MHPNPENIHRGTELPNNATESKVSAVAEAKTRSPDSLRHINDATRQFSSAKKADALSLQKTWQALSQPKQPLGQWLVERMAGMG